MTLTPRIHVDWSNDGGFSDTGEDVSARTYRDPPIRIERGRDSIRTLSPPMVGLADLELDNVSRDYSPSNGSSPIYGKVLPGRQVRIEVDHNGTVTGLFRGFLDEPDHRPGIGAQRVHLPVLGSLSWLRGKKISTALYQNYRTDQALGVILDNVGWPTVGTPGGGSWGTAIWGTTVWAAGGWPGAERVLNTGGTTLDWWWLDEEDAYDAAVALLNCEGPGAALYEDNAGKINFEGRHYRLVTARSTTVQATFRDTGAEPVMAEPFRVAASIKDIINICTVEIRKRTAKPLQAVWTLGSTATIGGNEVRKYIVRSSDPFTAALTPVAGTDYTLTAGSVSPSLDRTSGGNVTLTLTAGAGGATLTGLQLRAQPVKVDAATLVSNTISTIASQQQHGKRVWELPIRAEIPVNVAQDLCNAIVGLYQEPRFGVELTVEGTSDTHLDQQRLRQISDRIHVIEAHTGLDTDFWIEQIRHELGGLLRTSFAGQEVHAINNIGLWGTAIWGQAVWGF